LKASCRRKSSVKEEKAEKSDIHDIAEIAAVATFLSLGIDSAISEK
jgi:hypothetical protein